MFQQFWGFTRSLAEEQPTGFCCNWLPYSHLIVLFSGRCGGSKFYSPTPKFCFPCSFKLQVVWSLAPQLFLFLLMFWKRIQNGCKILYGLPVHPVTLEERIPNISPDGLHFFIIAKWWASFGLSRWLRQQRICPQFRSYRRYEFDPWVRKIPWRRTWQPTPVFLCGESHEQRSLAGYSP